MWEDTGMESVIEVENWIQCQVNRNECKKKKNERDACLVIQLVISEERKLQTGEKDFIWRCVEGGFIVSRLRRMPGSTMGPIFYCSSTKAGKQSLNGSPVDPL